MSNSKNRLRANVNLNDKIGEQRYQLYKAAFKWIKKSLDAGFYLEAISLEESFIADRLESRLSQLKGENYAFKTLGQIINEINMEEVDLVLKSLVVNEVNNWRIKRNFATHEIVKIEDNKFLSWEDRVELNKATAEEGLHLLREVDNRIKKLRSS